MIHHDSFQLTKAGKELRLTREKWKDQKDGLAHRIFYSGKN